MLKARSYATANRIVNNRSTFLFLVLFICAFLPSVLWPASISCQRPYIPAWPFPTCPNVGCGAEIWPCRD